MPFAGLTMRARARHQKGGGSQVSAGGATAARLRRPVVATGPGLSGWPDRVVGVGGALLARWRGPDDGAVGVQDVGPAAALLEAVVSAAQAAEVGGAGVTGGPGSDVVEVAGPRGTVATPHAAGAVAGADEVGDALGRAVGGGRGLQHGPGAGVEQRPPDLKRHGLQQRLDGVGVDDPDPGDLAPAEHRGDPERRTQPLPTDPGRELVGDFARGAGAVDAGGGGRCGVAVGAASARVAGASDPGRRRVRCR